MVFAASWPDAGGGEERRKGRKGERRDAVPCARSPESRTMSGWTERSG